MPLVTEKYTGSPLRKTTKGFVATRVFQVTDVASKQEALEAGGVPQLNESHPLSASMLCFDVGTEGGRSLYEVTASYAVPDSGSWTTKPSNPLNEKPRVRFRRAFQQYESDTDIDGKPIFNPAGDLYKPGATLEEEVLFLDYSRNEPFYDYNRASLYSGKVNSDGFTIGGVIVVPPEHCKCVGIMPADEFEPGPAYLKINYSFEIRLGGKYPFQERRLSVGNNGFYLDNSVTTKGRFVNANGDELSDVAIKLDGTPVDSTVKVGPNKAAPVTIGGGNIAFSNTFFDSETDATTGVPTLYFRRVKAVAFTGLI